VEVGLVSGLVIPVVASAAAVVGVAYVSLSVLRQFRLRRHLRRLRTLPLEYEHN
jgi:hypothetical protein